MSATEPHNESPLLELTQVMEGERALDGAVDLLAQYADVIAERPALYRALRGVDWLGHSLHPTLTGFPLGAWMSASMLDLIGPEDSDDAARRLVGLGILGVLPTALAGLTDWRALAEQSDRRTGVVHAGGNVAALAAYTCSWVARRRGKHRLGVALGLLGAGFAAGAGYLGGHLAENGTFAG